MHMYIDLFFSLQCPCQTAHHLPHRVPGLTVLNLAGIEGITASGAAYISFLPKLEKLSLARCKVRSKQIVLWLCLECRFAGRRHKVYSDGAGSTLVAWHCASRVISTCAAKAAASTMSIIVRYVFAQRIALGP